MYVHFGHGFFQGGKLNDDFVRIIRRVASRNGWFVPVSTMLDHLRRQRGEVVLTDHARRQLEWQWLRHKVRYGSA